MSDLTAFRWNQAEYERLIQTEVGADLAARALRVESAAKVFASGVGGGPQVRTGRLRGSITHRLGEDAEGIYAEVGSSVFYAPFVEYGTSRARAYPFLRPAMAAAR